MNGHDGIEQQKFENRQSTTPKNKSDKSVSKPETRLKSKFEFLKKLPHSVLSNSAVEKARTFFRSLELNHHDSSNSDESPSLLNEKHTTIISIPSSFNSTSISENTPLNDVLLTPTIPTIQTSTLNMIKIDKINADDPITHNDENDKKLPSNYFRNKYKQYLKPSLLLPRQYYNDILNRQNHNYSTSTDKNDSCTRSSMSVLGPNLTYSTRIYPPFNYGTPINEISPHDQMSILLSNYRSYGCCEKNASSDEQCHQSISPRIQPLPSSSSSSSMLTWNQCVRRLNTEYKLTINALQQVKECLEQVCLNPTKSISKYANVVARNNKISSNNERKKPTNVTFCLPPSSIIDEKIPSPSISIKNNERNPISPSLIFSKPKLIKPVELDTFSSPVKLESASSVVESTEKLDSIADIIKKFNSLNDSLSKPKVESPTINHCNHSLSSTIGTNTTNHYIHIEPSTKTCDLKAMSDQSLLLSSSSPSSSSEFIVINEEHQLENSLQDEETTYSIETFYKNSDNDENNLLSNHKDVVIIRENATEQQFNLAQENHPQEIQTNLISSQDTLNEPDLPSYINSLMTPLPDENFSSIETSSDYLFNDTSSSSTTPSTIVNSNDKTMTTSITLKNNDKSILQIPKLVTTTANVSRLKQPSKIILFSSKLKPPSSTIIPNTTIPIRKPIKMTNSKIQPPSSSIPKKQPLVNNNHISESQNQTNPTSSIGKNRVKSIVNQFNATASSHSTISSSKTNTRTYSSISTQPTTLNNKNIIQRK